MINKFAKMRDSWFTKLILIITALSFVSLFGVTGYIDSASNNRSVIKVDDITMSQSEFSATLQRDLNRLRALGIDFDADEEKKEKVANLLIKAKLNDALVDNTMRKYNVDFSDNTVRQLILIAPQFQNNGKFDEALFKEYLRTSGKTQNEVVADLKRNLARSILLDTQVEKANVPQILQKSMEKILGQRRTFKYVKIINNNAVISRQPSQDELDQYYEDMQTELTVPEKRDVTLMFISEEDMQKKIAVSAEEIEAYYKEHISDFEKPEQRHAWQMVFDNQEEAATAKARLDNGEDFASVAAAMGQKAEDIDLGYVGSDDISEDLAEIIFALGVNEISIPHEVADSWQILRVTEVKPASKMPKLQANDLILAELRQEKAYEGNNEIVDEIEDKLAGDAELASIAQDYNALLYEVKALDEEGKAEKNGGISNSVLANRDFIENVFAYNEGETTQVIETDTGFVVAKVDKIHEEHVLPREEATSALLKYWQENEKASITKEVLENVQNDLEAGDELNIVAQRYGLQIINSRPVNRGETIDKVSPSDMKLLFATGEKESETINIGDDYLVVETTKIYDDALSLSQEQKDALKKALSAEIMNEMSEALLNDFAADYKVEVNYHRMGLAD